MLALLTVVWGLTFPATKAALATTTPLQFLALRFGLASVLLLPLIFYRMRKFSQVPTQPRRSVAFMGIVIGTLLFAGYVLQAVGMRYTTASRSGFFTGLLTLFAPIFALLFRTSKAHLLTWFALPVAFFGVWLLADPSTGGLNKGDLLTILCAIVFALQMVSLEWTVHNHTVSPPVSRDLSRLPIPPLSISVEERLYYAQVLIGGLGSVLLALWEGEPLNITRTAWLGIAYTALFGNILAVWLQTVFQPRVPAGHAALVFTLEPLFAALFAWLLLGDSWTTRGLLGAGAIIVAMGISSLGMFDPSRSGFQPDKP